MSRSDFPILFKCCGIPFPLSLLQSLPHFCKFFLNTCSPCSCKETAPLSNFTIVYKRTSQHPLLRHRSRISRSLLIVTSPLTKLFQLLSFSLILFHVVHNLNTKINIFIFPFLSFPSGDVDGSIEAILDVLSTYSSHQQCKLEILKFGVGVISDKDVELAHRFEGSYYMEIHI